MAEKGYYMVLIRPKNKQTGAFIRGLGPGDQVRDLNGNPINGEPWIRFAVAHSFEGARAIAKKAIRAIGTENVLVAKIVPHDMIVVFTAAEGGLQG